MRKYKLLLLAGLLTACAQQPKNDGVVYYYDLDSLLEQQKETLYQQRAVLEKWAFVDNDTAKNSYTPDTTQWDDELTFFDKMNINKPVLQGVYETSELNDTKSNLKIRQFIPKKPKSVDVQYLKLYYFDKIYNIKKIEALYKEDNPIYKSTRHFTLEFDNRSGDVVLNRFIVAGGQKMLLKDTVQFQVVGKITQP